MLVLRLFNILHMDFVKKDFQFYIFKLVIVIAYPKCKIDCIQMRLTNVINYTMPTSIQKASVLAQTLQWFVHSTLIPGEMGPAIWWLSNRTTVELMELVEWHKLAITNGDRVGLMKAILAHYFTQPIALDTSRVQTN